MHKESTLVAENQQIAKNETKVEQGGQKKRKPAAIALGISQPKLRAKPGSIPSGGKPLAAAAQTETSLPVALPTSEARPASEALLIWSPWYVILRQQTLVAHALSNVMRAQLQFSRMLSL